jgi:hypothetical protein
LHEAFIRKTEYHWDAKVDEALKHIDQGTVIPDIPLAYAANGQFGVMPQTKVALQQRIGGVILATIDVMVTSQTCDIRGPGGKKSPLITVAPIYPARDLILNATKAAIDSSAYLVALTSLKYASDLYVADLRFETAIEKSLVADRAISPGVDSRDGQFLLAKKLSEFRRRAAFDVSIENEVIGPLQTLISESFAPEDIYEIRVFADPSISRASTVRLIVVCDLNADVEMIRATITRWYDDARPSSTLILLPLVVKRIDDISLEEVRGAVPIFFRDLSGHLTDL